MLHVSARPGAPTWRRAGLLMCLLLAALQARTQAKQVVCLDPGHPSETSVGATGNGLSERTINWQVAVAARKMLIKARIRCTLTKSRGTEYVTNRRRAEIANRAGAALFVRLHCDGSGPPGFRWYYPDRSATLRGVTGPPETVRYASRRAALELTASMAKELDGVLAVHPPQTDAMTAVGARQGGVLTGSVHARVPTVLLEMCNLRSRHDAAVVRTPAGRLLVARALSHAIIRCLRAHGAERTHAGP